MADIKRYKLDAAFAELKSAGQVSKQVCRTELCAIATELENHR
jgi:hypothetical protein